MSCIALQKRLSYADFNRCRQGKAASQGAAFAFQLANYVLCDMQQFTIQTVAEPDFSQKEQIRALWNAHYPASLELKTPADLDEYLSKLTDRRYWLVSDEHETICGWGITFTRENETWFAIVMGKQRSGAGSRVLEAMKVVHPELNGWVIDNDTFPKLSGEPYLSPLNFYLKAGFTVLPEIRLDNEKMQAVKIRWSEQ